MVKIINSPEAAVLKGIDNITHLSVDVLLIPTVAAQGQAGFASEDEEGKPVICVNGAVPYERVYEIIVKIAAGLASEYMQQSQEEIEKQIIQEIDRLTERGAE